LILSNYKDGSAKLSQAELKLTVDIIIWFFIIRRITLPSPLFLQNEKAIG
jgi:hypothetical protein